MPQSGARLGRATQNLYSNCSLDLFSCIFLTKGLKNTEKQEHR